MVSGDGFRCQWIMRLVIAIFGLLGALSAQVICRPLDSMGNFDWSTPDIQKMTQADNNPPVKNYLVTELHSRPVRCFEYVGGTIALYNGKIVHSAWLESTPLEQWPADVSSCSASRSKEPLFRFMKRINESNAQEPKTAALSIPVEFCQAVDH